MKITFIFVAVLIVAACTTMTVVIGTNGATVSEEDNKGVVIKPKIDKDNHEKDSGNKSDSSTHWVPDR